MEGPSPAIRSPRGVSPSSPSSPTPWFRLVGPADVDHLVEWQLDVRGDLLLRGLAAQLDGELAFSGVGRRRVAARRARPLAAGGDLRKTPVEPLA